MLYKIASPSVAVSADAVSVSAAGDVVRSADAGATWQLVAHFQTSIGLTTDATVIANAMATLALQLAQKDALVGQVQAQVAALLASPPYTVSL